MDPAFGTHCHRIDSSNIIEYSAPHPSKVKYTPPSPTTSGYSESGSEIDNPDSGRVSEMEGSPKMQPRRPETISLNMGMFTADQSQITSPDPFPEGKSTIKMGRTASSDSALLSETPRFLAISEQTLRTLVVCLHETRTRLDRMETKMDLLVKGFQLHYRQSSESSRKLARAVLALGNDHKGQINPFGLENGRRFPKFQDPISATKQKVCTNDNLPSSSTKSSKIQSPVSTSPPDFTHNGLPLNDVMPEPSSRSGAPSYGDTHEESNDVFLPENSAPERFLATHADDEIIKKTKERNSDKNVGDKSKASPVYAVVRKTNKSTETLGSNSEEPPALPRRSQELLTTTEDGPTQDDIKQMMEIVQELKEGDFTTPKDDAFSNGESLTRVSRFSEVESLLSVLETCSDDRTSEDGSVVVEQYDNKDSDVFEEDIFSPSPYRNLDSGIVTHEFPYENREAPSITSSWLSAQHEVGYFSPPTVERTLHVQPTDNVRQSDQNWSESTPELLTGDTALPAVIGSGNRKEDSDKKSNKKSSSEKNLSEDGRKKSIVSNYSKLFKRKGKKKRSESQNSFTFVTSPLYEAQVADSKRKGESPRSIRRGQSVDSVASSERSRITSFNNLSCSKEGCIGLETNQGELNSASGVGKTTTTPDQSFANLLNLGLPAEEFPDVEEHYDNFGDQENEDMRPNIVQLAKKAFRNSPKILRKNRSTPIVQTAELKPKINNGHSRAHGSSLPATPELPPKEALTSPESTPENVVIRREDDIEEDVFVSPGVILERLQREQADRIRFETGHSPALDNPPPKPNRPGYPHGGVQSSPRSSVNAHQNGSVPGYPRGMPAVPPKQKIMTPEELTNHEAHEKLRRKQMEEAMLQQTLNQQQKQAAENALWLEQEEHMLSPDVNGDESPLRRGRGSSNSLADMRGTMEAPPPPSVAPSKPPRKSSRPKDEPAGPPQTKLEEVKTAPTMQLNRDDDEVYKNTMEVVKSVLGMNNMTMSAKPDELFNSVKSVGAALKQLCASLEGVLPDLPEDFHREIDMAQRTTNKDLSQVINQLKLVQRFYATTQVVDYKKCLMAANQVLAIDAKNLLDVVDRARIRKIQNAQEQAKFKAEDVRLGAASQPNATGYEPEDLYPDGDFL